MNKLTLLSITSMLPAATLAVDEEMLRIHALEDQAVALTPAVVEYLKEQNLRHADLTEEELIALDDKWRAEVAAGGGSLVQSVLENAVSQRLHNLQIVSSGRLSEIFLMDNKGLNVGQSVVTSDYWQGDEDKFQKSFGAGEVFVDVVGLDASTNVLQTQVSLPVKDPENKEIIGAITFGVRVR